MLLSLPFSDDEAFVLVVSLGLALVAWIWWYHGLRAGRKLRSNRAPRRALALVPLVALVVLYLVLARWASFDVRDSGPYLFQYLALGAAWVGTAAHAFAWLGTSARDDVAERENAAAAAALSGALLGVMLCFAGGNIGDGPGWWVVVFSSGLATLAFFVLWGVLEGAAHPSDAVTIDRDLAAGVRLGAFGVAQGIVLGRAAAGDWKSAGATLADFATNGWPALALLVAAIVFERALRPSPEAPRRALFLGGVVPGVLLLAGASCWIAWIGVGP